MRSHRDLQIFTYEEVMNPIPRLIQAVQAVEKWYDDGCVGYMYPKGREKSNALFQELEIALAVARLRHKPVDAMRWAKRFCEYVKLNPAIATDPQCMVGWFANAIMSEYDGADYLPPPLPEDK